MTVEPVPQFPIYIVSKSRAEIALTPAALDAMKVPYRLVVEEQQADAYAERWGAEKILVLDPAYQRDYDTCDDVGDEKGKGPGPARNFAWEHSIAEGAPWHWVMDDNIRLFARLHKNQRIPVGDGMIFRAMEDFCLRYENVGMAGPDYWMFAPSREKVEPFTLNHRIFSCNLIRNDVGLRWRARYNEDLDLSIRCLKAGWATVLFKAFLQWKTPTQELPGGNTEEFYAREGTLEKSRMAVKLHPDLVRLTKRYGRDHHVADFSKFRSLRLVRKPDVEIPEGDPYRMKIAERRYDQPA